MGERKKKEVIVVTRGKGGWRKTENRGGQMQGDGRKLDFRW